MLKKFMGITLAVFFLSGLIIFTQPQSSWAENRYLAQKYGFDATGSLTSPLVIDFGSGSKTAHVASRDLATNRKLLLIAFAMPEEKVFALQLFDSSAYSLYRVKLRDSKREEIVVMGLGPAGDKKVLLKELFIIAQDEAGELKAMSVKGFSPETVLNAPMQLDGNRNIVLHLGVSGKNMKIYWDAAAESFVSSNGVVKAEEKVD